MEARVIDRKITDFWGTSLSPVSISESLKSQMPEDTISYLQEIGLPDWKRLPNTLNVRFNLNSTDMTIIEFQSSQYIVLGDFHEEKIGMVPQVGGIYMLNLKPPPRMELVTKFHTIRFANTNIQLFVYFHTLYVEYRPKWEAQRRRMLAEYPDIDENDANTIRDNAETRYDEIVHELKHKFTESDPTSLQDESCWWWWIMFNLEVM